jgi:outer membrane biosynthesis protein TonB
VAFQSFWRPLDFDPVIVLLTAVHFHYAGFLLPLCTALAAREVGGRGAAAACWRGPPRPCKADKPTLAYGGEFQPTCHRGRLRAMARRRTLDRRALRENAEAAERQTGEDEKEKAEDEEEDEEEEEEAESEEEAADDDEEAPKPKAKAKAKPKKKAPAKPRTRAVKVVRLRAVWAVLDNASKRVETFPYSKKADAEAFIVEKAADKKNYYLQLVKEPWEDS